MAGECKIRRRNNLRIEGLFNPAIFFWDILLVFHTKRMVTYCFSTEDGRVCEESFFRGEAPEFIRVWRIDAHPHFRAKLYPSKDIEGLTERAYRDYRAENVTGTVASSQSKPSGWPMAPCVGSGVHASQGKELSDYLKERSCPTEVVDGDPIYISPAHRKKALKLRGLHDKASYC